MTAGRWSFLLTRRWITLGLVLVIVAIACGFLSRWQWHRFQWRTAQIQLIERNYGATPVALAQILPEPSSPLSKDDEWRTVTATGHYLNAKTTLIRNRVQAGETGYYYLVPLELDDGAIVWVARGWLPNDIDTTHSAAGFDPSHVPAPPRGEVTVVAHLRTMEPAGNRTAPPGQAQTTNVDALTARAGLTADPYRAIAVLDSEDPQAADAPTPLSAPDLNPGSHLSYTFQWIVFGVIALGSFLVLARREVAAEVEGDASGETADATPTLGGRAKSSRPPRPSRRPRPRRMSAEEEEDALLDAAEAQTRGVSGGPEQQS